MNGSELNSYIFSQLQVLIPMILITFGCLFYIKRSLSMAGVMMLMGNLVLLLIQIAFIVITVIQTKDTRLYRSLCFENYHTIISGINFLAGLIFGFGFILMAVNHGRPEE